MGLADPRKRMKLSHDPNNTRWSRDTGSFGHKIMTSQGWQPGNYLGAKDAPHAEFHTVANASHIKVFVKDDNLGLGAKKGSGLAQGECTGLDAFQALLGRLNGKNEDELQKETKSRKDLKRAIYSEQKWGSVRFVKGGFLIGDRIQKLIEDEADRIRLITESSYSETLETNSKESCSADIKSKTKRKDKKNKKNKKDKKDEKDKKDKKDRKDKEDMKAKENVLETTIATDETVKDDDAAKQSKDKKLKRKFKRVNKGISEQETAIAEKVAKKKREMDVTGIQKDQVQEDAILVPEVSGERERTSKQSASNNDCDPKQTSGASKEPFPFPSNPPDSSPPDPRHFLGNRYAVRRQAIKNKRLAHVSDAALDQIFMIKRP